MDPRPDKTGLYGFRGLPRQVATNLQHVIHALEAIDDQEHS